MFLRLQEFPVIATNRKLSMPLPYNIQNINLAEDGNNNPALVRALQRNLRALGYLHEGIEGEFGSGTAQAVRSLQYDLINNNGASTRGDGPSPVAMTLFNKDDNGGQRISGVSGVLDQSLAQCLEAILNDPRVPQLPCATDPAAENRAALAAIAGSASTVAPTPFMTTIIVLESNGEHFHVPRQGDSDTFVTIGLDRNDSDTDHITSRGYGIGQYTLFHHPPSASEIVEYVADPVRNVQNGYRELRDKFDKSVAGPADKSDDRSAEHPLLPLRPCKYAPGDQRYLNDCRACAASARKVDIVRGTPCYPGASISYQPTKYHPSATYSGVPDRADFACDWPYATRRYNGSGVDSFHYQTRVLLQLLQPPIIAGS
jgi:hypothetical protein